MKYFIAILIAVSLFVACKKPAVAPAYLTNSMDTILPPTIDTIIPPPPAPADTGTAPRYYLALGDSYTIGQSVLVEERFPMQTAKNLTALSLNFLNPEIIARTGWTTGNLINALSATPPKRPTYDAVSILIGVNNQYQHLSQDQYATEFSTLLNKAIIYADNKPNRVFVLSIPDYSVTPFANGSNQMLVANQIDSL